MPYVCLHAHFYQPSREDPWTGVWPVEPTAAPWRDWNERISAECYAPNAAARLLGPDGRLRGVVDNYRHVSFDFGPTLLQWLETNRPVVYEAIRRADRASARRLGHGNAMAQGYHHAILPLCDPADRRTEIVWGLRDFELRFGRRAEGLWLPEAAVDLPTLDEVAAHEVRFVVLAPWQVRRVRPPGADRWLEAHEVPDLTRRAYRVKLPSGRTIAVFPYDGELARGVAFDGWLHDGAGLAARLLERARNGDDPDALVHLATDGESYGHHHRNGDMALARAVELLEAAGDVDLVNYTTFLERVPPTWDAEVAEHTSWSCAHGLERWRSDCGCCVDPGSGFHQRWRAPLRAAFDALRDAAREATAPLARALFRDPATARDRYVDLLREHAPETFHAWFREHAAHPGLSTAELRKAHAWLELQRHLLAMYTSCAWFFDDATGIEARQNVRHAACALGLLHEEFGIDLHEPFVQRLAALPANRDPQALVDLVQEARHHPRPIRAPHAPSTLGALAEEGPVGPPRREEVSSLFPRAAGLLLHVTSLPGDGPVGDLDAAPGLVDWLVQAGVSIWQVLPTSPVDEHGSPYATWSALSGNPLLIGLRPLVEAGLLSADEARAPEGPIGRIDLHLARTWKIDVLERAARRLLARPDHPWNAELAEFVETNPWAREAARFRAAKQALGGAPWWTWPVELRQRRADAVAALDHDVSGPVAIWQVLEFFFDSQWRALRTYCAGRGVSLFGDVPIYVGWDSVDVWAAQHLFLLDERGHPTVVAGVPPDAFSATGQRWGSPIYDWEAMADDGYAWWIRRLRRALELTDYVRLDHFIGFVNYWAVPADAPDARSGRWVDGPGRAFFEAVEAALGPLPFVVEDLGEVGPHVRAVQESLGYPGMRVLQFAFDGSPHNEHLPSRHPTLAVSYVGTHDNDTVVGWWNGLTPGQRAAVRAHFRDPAGHPAVELPRLAARSPAVCCVITAQDVLALGEEARFNTPGTTEGNWRWRLRPGQLDDAAAERLRRLVREAGRLPPSAR